MVSNLQQSASPIGLVLALWRHRVLTFFLIAFFLCLSAAALIVIKPKYESEGKLYVRIGRQSVTLDPTATTTQTLNIVETRENEINSIYESLKSREIIERLVDQYTDGEILETDDLPQLADSSDPWSRLNPFAVYDYRDEKIAHVMNKMSVTVIKKSNIIVISYLSKRPEFAQKIVGDMIRLCKETHIKANDQPQSLGFFEERSAALKQALAEAGTRVREFKSANGISDFAKQRDILVSRKGNLENNLLDVQVQIDTLEQEQQQRKTSLSSLPTTIESESVSNNPNTAVEGMRQQLFGLQVKESEVLAKYKEDHPEVVSIRAQIELAKKQLKEEPNDPQVKRTQNESHKVLQLTQLSQNAVLYGLKAKQDTLARQLSSTLAEMSQLNAWSLELDELERNLRICETNYLNSMKQMEESNISRSLAQEKISNINTVQEPTLSKTPASPKVSLILSFGLVVGCVAAVLVALWLERHETSDAASVADSQETAVQVKQQLMPEPMPAAVASIAVPNH